MCIQPTFSHSSESQCSEQACPLTCQHTLPHRLPFWDSRPNIRWWELNFSSQEHLALLSLRIQEDFRHYCSMPCPDTWLTKWHWCWLTSKAVDSDCQQRGENERVEQEKRPYCFFQESSIWDCWRVLSLTILWLSRSSLQRSWLHICFFS